jgi:hypothetical protein
MKFFHFTVPLSKLWKSTDIWNFFVALVSFLQFSIKNIFIRKRCIGLTMVFFCTYYSKVFVSFDKSVASCLPILHNSHPHLLVLYPVLTNEEMTTESQRYNCFIRNGGNAIPKHAGPEAKGSNPTTGLILLWARNPFRGNFNHWLISRKEAGQIFFKRRHGCQEGFVISYKTY